MGARINFVFKDDLNSAVVLYSHWGQTGWEHDIAGALEHARPRWNDYSYATRMMISYLIKEQIMEETGFGIYSITGDNYDFGDQTVVINLINHTVTDNVPVTWDNFIKAFSPEHAAV